MAENEGRALLAAAGPPLAAAIIKGLFATPAGAGGGAALALRPPLCTWLQRRQPLINISAASHSRAN